MPDPTTQPFCSPQLTADIRGVGDSAEESLGDGDKSDDATHIRVRFGGNPNHDRLIVVRSDGDDWTRHEALASSSSALPSMGCTLDVDDILRDPLK